MSYVRILPKFSIPHQKIPVDNQARLRYRFGYWFSLIDASICCAEADAGTQLTFFNSSAREKQLPIFQFISSGKATSYLSTSYL